MGEGLGGGGSEKTVALRYFMSLARNDISRGFNFAIRQVGIKSLLACVSSVGDVPKLSETSFPCPRSCC